MHMHVFHMLIFPFVAAPESMWKLLLVSSALVNVVATKNISAGVEKTEYFPGNNLFGTDKLKNFSTFWQQLHSMVTCTK